MSQKATDAANNAPYLTHLVGHRRQLSLVPPDNTGRMRQAKQKKQRSGNPDDELRFNTGPKFYKVSTSSRASTDARSHPRSSRTGRRTAEVRENEYVDDGSSIPNYPPPSFDEAMSSPPISICPSTGTFINPSPRTAHSYSPNSLSPSTPQVSPGAASASSASTEDLSDNDSDSDASLMVSARSSSPYEPPSPSGMEISRSPTPGSTMGDLEAEYDAELISAPNTPTSSKQPSRSRLSLSPLRTLLPRRSSSSTRAISAHPYCQSKNPSSFFRSTTSLSTFAFGRSTTSAPEADEDKGEQEDFDSWEVVRRPTSLLLNVEMAMSTNEGLPTERLSPLPPPEPASSHTNVPPSAPPSVPPSVSTSAPPLPPLVDKKTPFPKPKVKKEPKRRDTTQSQTTIPNTSPPGSEAGPILTTVRTRRTYSPSPAAQRSPIPGSPLRSEASYPRADAQPQAILEKAINTPLPITPTEKAVDNKERGGLSPLSPFPATVTSSSSSSLENQTIAPSQNVRGPMHDARQDHTHARSHSSTIHHNNRAPSPDVLARTSAHAFPTLSRPIMPPINTINTQEGPASRRGSPSPVPPTPSSSSTYTITPTHTPTQSHFAHHYLGRPLPRPPPSFSRDMVDSTYAGSVAESFVSAASTMCPEGLLIDFDEPAQSSSSVTPVPTLMHQRSEVHEGGRPLRSTHWSTSSNRHSHVLGRIPSPAEQASRNRTESATRAASVTEPNPRGELSHFTDLDLLIAGLDDSQLQDGSGYDALLMVSEFMGPASPDPPSRRSSNASSQRTTRGRDSTTDSCLPAPVLGHVSVDRRRITKDGRVKVKLVAFESAIDKCGICLVQFKEGDLAAMSSNTCRHTFHEICLKKWLRSGASKTCPSCRVKVGDLRC
ncbi:hypothetical protein PQX77_003379 [Marasmius sp. AFHP31]|nr:hypothetical protein PQX77_003379 [Marasmius sp. AFHP31]